MGAVAVQKYEKTTDPKRMMTHAVLNEAIRTDWKNVREFLPARTATSMRYDKGAKKAVAWNEGGAETKIDLPLNDGWYVSDGNPFAIPNGKTSNPSDPEALHLVRHQDRSYVGPVGRGGYFLDDDGRVVVAVDGWSDASGVALIGRDAIVASDNAPIVRGVEQSGAAAPLVGVPAEKLVNVADPKALVLRAEQLEAMANDFNQRFNGVLTAEMHQRFVTEPLETAKMLREVAGKIEVARG